MNEKNKLVIPSKKFAGETSVVSTRMPLGLVKDLDAIAEKTGRTRNEIILLCLEFAIQNTEVLEQKEKR